MDYQHKLDELRATSVYQKLKAGSVLVFQQSPITHTWDYNKYWFLDDEIVEEIQGGVRDEIHALMHFDLIICDRKTERWGLFVGQVPGPDANDIELILIEKTFAIEALWERQEKEEVELEESFAKRIEKILA